MSRTVMTITRGVGHSTLESDTRINRVELPTVAPTCPSCQSHNVTDGTGLGHCGDCNLTDNMSAFMGGGMTANAKFQPSRFGKSGGSSRTFDRSSPRGWTISGRVD